VMGVASEVRSHGPGSWDGTGESVTSRGFLLLMGVVRAFSAAAPMSFSAVSVIADALRLRRARL